MRWLSGFLCLSAACSTGPGLGAAKDLSVAVALADGVEATLRGAVCPRLSGSATATLDGAPGQVRERGGRDGASCRAIRLAFPPSAGPAFTLVVTDGAARVEVQVVKRALPALEVGQPCPDAGPCREVYRLGESVPVRWTPPLPAERAQVNLKNAAPVWRTGQGLPPCTPGRCPKSMALSPGELQVEVPRTVLAGPLGVTVHVAFPAFGVARCVGAASCTVASPAAVVSVAREVRVE